jgi:uncharacterized membrane protein required for colicin V production
MLTQIFKSINWVDVAAAALFARLIFISVKNGFVVEIFKFLGVICAVFFGLHLYSRFAEVLVHKTTLPLASWQFLMFLGIWILVGFGFKFLRDGVMLLFKVETTHQGFDQYAAGFLAAGRAIFISSMVIFALLLMHHPFLHRQAASSWAYKITGKAAPNTYSFLYHNVVGRLFPGQQFNADVFAVVESHGVNPK